MNDPTVAEFLATAGGLEDAAPARPSLAEFTPEVAMLSNIVDRLGEVVAIQTVIAGGKAQRVQPAPRPVTGVDRARKRLEDARHSDLVDEVAQAQARWVAAQTEAPSSSAN